MKQLRSFVAITLCVVGLSMFPMVASANTNEAPSTEPVLTITEDNAQAIIESAQQGDENAIKAINNLDCFNPEKIKQKGTLKVSQKEGSKEYHFADGSSIIISVGREVSPLGYTYIDHGMHQWKAAGIEIARYLIYHEIELEGDGRHGWSIDHWDDSDALPGVYSVTEYGTEILSGDDYDVCWTLRGAGKFINNLTGVSSPKYIFEFYDDVAGNSHTLEVIYP